MVGISLDLIIGGLSGTGGGATLVCFLQWCIGSDRGSGSSESVWSVVLLWSGLANT